MIHHLSEVKSKNIGKNTNVWQFCVILENAVVGENCNINCNVFIENNVIIGNNVTIKTGVQIWDGINIDNNVFIGPNVTFTNDLIPRSKVYPEKYSNTFVKEYASIGANSTILAGITIGKYSLVGAGSLVTKSIPPFTVWYGNPARHKGYITRDSILLDLKLYDKKGNQYVVINDEPIKQI